MDHSRLCFLLDRAPPDDDRGSATGSLSAQVAADRAFEQVVREHRGIATSAVVTEVTRRLPGPAEDTGRTLREAMKSCLLDPSAPVAMLAPDVLVHAPTLYAGAVFTHRLTVSEQADGELEIHTDLAPFQRSHAPRVDGTQLYAEDREHRAVVWFGAFDWLHHLPLDALLAVRVSPDVEVTIVVLDAEPPSHPGLVQLLRAVYDDETAHTGLPVTAEDLALGMLLRDPGAFAWARPPLVELAAAAGLERRGHEFSHGPQPWSRAAALEREMRLTAALGPGPGSAAAVRAVSLLDDGRPHGLREALDLLHDPLVLHAVMCELVSDTVQLVALADRLVEAADLPPREAVARWLAAVAAERDARVLDAEAHLRSAARHGDGWAPAERRLVDYGLDHERPVGIGGLEWLLGRAEAHLRRTHEFGTSTLAEVADLVGCDDRLVVDVLLHEDGGFTRFVADRGPLIPSDDARAAAGWDGTERTVYEVLLATAAGSALRDLRTGEEITVVGRRAVGSRVCGRAVPDGAMRRLVGVLLDVPTGWDRQLRRVLDRHDGRGLLAWVAAANGPTSRLVDGEPAVHCQVVLRAPGAVAHTLNELYFPLDRGWWARFGDRDEMQGTAILDGNEVTVAASSEARMDLMLGELAAALPGLSIMSEERRPMRPRE